MDSSSFTKDGGRAALDTDGTCLCGQPPAAPTTAEQLCTGASRMRGARGLAPARRASPALPDISLILTLVSGSGGSFKGNDQKISGDGTRHEPS